MKALLLAAGLGTRLRPLTDALPKCMISVGGKPVLQRNIEWLHSHGVDDLIINLHHCPEAVMDYFGDGRDFGVQISYSYEDKLWGTAGAAQRARALLGAERFLVVYADNLLDCNLLRLYTVHTSRQALLTMALFWRQTNISASSTVSFEADGRVTAFKEKPRLQEVQSHWINAGLMLCEPEVLQFIPDNHSSDFGHDIFPALLQANKRVYSYTMQPHETLRWIDTPADLAHTDSLYKQVAQAG